MSRKQTPKFAKVSEWIAAGNMASGLYLLETVNRETDKAIGFACKRGNAYGFLVDGTCYLPKSQLQRVENDFYTSGAATMWLCPAWLCERKMAEGIEI